jgi:hypothetical protein
MVMRSSLLCMLFVVRMALGDIEYHSLHGDRKSMAIYSVITWKRGFQLDNVTLVGLNNCDETLFDICDVEKYSLSSIAPLLQSPPYNFTGEEVFGKEPRKWIAIFPSATITDKCKESWPYKLTKQQEEYYIQHDILYKTNEGETLAPFVQKLGAVGFVDDWFEYPPTYQYMNFRYVDKQLGLVEGERVDVIGFSLSPELFESLSGEEMAYRGDDRGMMFADHTPLTFTRI